MDTARLRELLDRRDELDQEIRTLVNGEEKRSIKCSRCGSDSHNIRKCNQKDGDNP